MAFFKNCKVSLFLCDLQVIFLQQWSNPVIPKLGYAYLQGYKPGHLGVHKKIK